MSAIKIALVKCPICGKYPRLMKSMDRYKYFCGVHCSSGDWKHTKNGSRKSWNIRILEKLN